MILNFTDPFFTTRVLGFEPLFDRLQRLSESSERSSSYPPYNIRKDGNYFAIEIAVAGLTKDDINIELSDGVLSVVYEGPNTQVVNEKNELIGIISEGDCIKQISESRYYNMPMQDQTIKKHMASNVETIDGNMNIFDAATKFLEAKRRRFPIVENGKLVGQISQKDVLKAAMQLKGQNWK